MASPLEISRVSRILRAQFGATEATVQLSEIFSFLESCQKAYEEKGAARQQQHPTPQATATTTATAPTAKARQQQHPRPRLP